MSVGKRKEGLTFVASSVLFPGLEAAESHCAAAPKTVPRSNTMRTVNGTEFSVVLRSGSILVESWFGFDLDLV